MKKGPEKEPKSDKNTNRPRNGQKDGPWNGFLRKKLGFWWFWGFPRAQSLDPVSSNSFVLLDYSSGVFYALLCAFIYILQKANEKVRIES